MSRPTRRRKLLLPIESLEPRQLLANAFPEAEGFGALATGGRGGSVYHVTNLNDTGAGSFRDAVAGSNRTVVFDVGGVITINSQVAFSNNITVEGQTAPGGIVVYGDGVSLSNRNNIIIRYITFRQGLASGSGDKALNITNGFNMMLDHVSVAWGRWDSFGITDNSHDITFQNCILGEAIDPQNFGGLIDSSSNLTLARNLFINNNSRNPKGKAHMQYINNVIYNWGGSGYVGGHSSAPWNQDLINNYWIAGPSSSLSGYLSGFAATDQIYNSGNYFDQDKIDQGGDGLPEGNLISDSEFTSRSATINASAFNNPTVPTTIMTAQQAYQYVRDNVGNSFRRDAADTRLIGYVKSQGSKGAIIDDEATVAGQPPVFAGTALADTDGDGMSNVWESANGTNPSVADNNGDVNADGYTNLENYVNGIVAAGLPAGTPTVQNAAASALVGATSNLTVLGADDDGEAGLTYTWASSGPGSVGFSANGSNAAKNVTATFNRAGTFALVAKIQDAAGNFTTSSVYVTVAAVYTTVTISPSSANLSPTQTQQFTATMRDQFGQSMGTAPAPSWQMVSGGGTIDSNGLYTAPAAAGSAVVRGGYAGKTNTANVTIVNPGAIIQAETQTIGGSGTVLESTNAGFNGTAYINFGTSNGFLQFNGVQGGSGGSTVIRFRYAMGVAARTGLLLVNGVSQGNVTFPTTSAWTTWTTIQLTVPLNVGATNTIRLETIGSGDMANVDELQVDINVPPSTYNGTASGDQYYLKRNGPYLQIWNGGDGTGSPTYTIDYSMMNTMVFNGSGGDDTLTIDNSLGNAIPAGGITFDGGSGTLDSLVVIGTSGADATTFNSSAVTANGTVNLANVETRKLKTNGNADTLTIVGGPVKLATTGKFYSLGITAGAGTLDVGAVGLAQDYGSVSPIGNWEDTAYTGVTGMIQSGAISSSAITSGLYALGVGEASDVLGASGGNFGGESVDGSAVLVKFTYAGDATLDGKINIDDYTKIDAGIANAATGWSNGDFNYDGKINIDDYVIIDNNITNQGGTLANGAGLANVSASKLIWNETDERTIESVLP